MLANHTQVVGPNFMDIFLHAQVAALAQANLSLQVVLKLFQN